MRGSGVRQAAALTPSGTPDTVPLDLRRARHGCRPAHTTERTRRIRDSTRRVRDAPLTLSTLASRGRATRGTARARRR
jgi:hypothetical protein